MMTELSEIRSELSDCVDYLLQLDDIFTLALEQPLNKPDQVWQRQVCWILSELASCLDCRADMIRSQVYALKQLQAAQSREAAS